MSSIKPPLRWLLMLWARGWGSAGHRARGGRMQQRAGGEKAFWAIGVILLCPVGWVWDGDESRMILISRLHRCRPGHATKMLVLVSEAKRKRPHEAWRWPGLAFPLLPPKLGGRSRPLWGSQCWPRSASSRPHSARLRREAALKAPSSRVDSVVPVSRRPMVLL